MKHYKMTIQILSPVHIGSGQDIDPLEYVVKGGVFYRLDLPKFLSQMDGALRAEFNRKAADPNPIVLRDFIHRHADPQKNACFTADGGAFEATYQQNLKNPNTRLEITLMTRTPGNWQAYIPGSSIKGAIRTAVVSKLANDKPLRNPNPKFFEKDVLGFGDAKQDPFRCVRISDAPLPEAATFIDKAEIFKLNKGIGPDPAGIQMFYEQCFSLLDGETIVAVGTLAIDDQLPSKRTFDRRQKKEVNAVSMSLNAFDLLKACRDFYLPKMQAEHNTFYQSNTELEANSQRLLDVQYADNEFPIRLGRFSHVECTTVDDYRKPQTRRTRDGKSLPYGTTRTLSAGTMPMGWAKVRLEPIR
ncbi:MAG TPA: hypothetical protein ENN97_07555 [Phycisphaerales bacterium]|nr:hypothetical protein [Phycisphaerales bacterium]